MLGFYDRIQGIKNTFLDGLAEKASKYDNVIIYGAGRVAKPIYEKLMREGIEVSFFAVSDKRLNEDIFLGVPVMNISDIHLKPEKTIFIIAVKIVWADEVLAKIRENGYVNYIYPPKEIDYFAREESDVVYRPVMEMSLKAGCSVNCRYCPQSLFLEKYFADPERDILLSLENYKKCLHKLPQDTIISFCGFTEPFLNPQCIQMIEYTNAQGYEMKLYTTLVGLTKEGFERIRNIPFHYVVLHTPDAQGYANIPMTEEYFEVLDMMLEQKKPDGSRFIDTANCQGIPHPKVLEHTEGKLRIMSQLYDRAGNIKDDEVFQHIQCVKGKIYCVRVNKKLDYNVMLPDGTVLLCDFDFGMRHIIGNLFEQSYEEIMDGDEMRRIVRGLDDDSMDLLCRKCNYAVRTEDGYASY